MISDSRRLEQRSGSANLPGRARARRAPLVALWLALAVLVAVPTGLALHGCAAQNPAQPTVATVNQDITQGLAGAIAAANTAEQLYNAGQIPQTAAARTAINTLGESYNDARAAYLIYLGAVSQQVAACQPAVTSTTSAGSTSTPAASASALAINGQAVTCASATTGVTNASAALQAKVNAMTTATSAVTALQAAPAAK